MRDCPKCGEQLSDDVWICPGCATRKKERSLSFERMARLSPLTWEQIDVIFTGVVLAVALAMVIVLAVLHAKP